jgi:DNA mismatch endonuclease (patch repair protein)
LDNLTKEKRSKIMSAIKRRDTAPELLVRRLVHSLGYRYRVDDPSVPGRPDMVFRSRRKVIFVHGCFWHVHAGCPLSHVPAGSFWRKKLAMNQERDKDSMRKLRSAGWKCLVVWECQAGLTGRLRALVSAFLGS